MTNDQMLKRCQVLVIALVGKQMACKWLVNGGQAVT
jgi:hypothetical protein